MFKPHIYDDGRVGPWEFHPCSAMTPKLGLAMKFNSDGRLTTASGTDKPGYICMMEAGAAVAADTLIPVMKVTPLIVWETEFSAAATSIKPGAKVTIATDGLRATATTTDGVATVVSMDGTASGSAVRVRFE